jgi:hypothetical protein
MFEINIYIFLHCLNSLFVAKERCLIPLARERGGAGCNTPGVYLLLHCAYELKHGISAIITVSMF